MIILPAIDLKNKTAVRLYQGDFGTAEKVADDPVKTAKRFEKEGADWIHTVDLDGALKGYPVNMDIIEEIIQRTALKVEIGGGIRTMDIIDEYMKLGAARIILGSVALSEPDLVRRAVHKYGDKVAVGIDARSGKVKSNGWIDESDVGYLDLAKKMEEAGVRTMIYTDISKDGTLSGPDFEGLNALNAHVEANIIASGGVSSIDDIRKLASRELYGAICGKAIYTGDLKLAEAISVSDSQAVQAEIKNETNGNSEGK